MPPRPDISRSNGPSDTARAGLPLRSRGLTKAAHVGIDRVAEMEQGIPEDDLRNPATIADNVGTKGGDCAGMAADLSESYEVVLVASIILGVASLRSIGAKPGLGLVFPVIVRAIGVVANLPGKATPKGTSAMAPTNRGFLTAGVLTLIGTLIVALTYVGNENGTGGKRLPGAGATVLGLAQVVIRPCDRRGFPWRPDRCSKP